MEQNIISWNIANWITVVLMAVIGWAIYRYIINFTKIRMEQKGA